MMGLKISKSMNHIFRKTKGELDGALPAPDASNTLHGNTNSFLLTPDFTKPRVTHYNTLRALKLNSPPVHSQMCYLVFQNG